MEKLCRGGQATDGNMAHVHCMPDTQGYKHILRISNIYCLSTATMVARTRLNVHSILPVLFYIELTNFLFTDVFYYYYPWRIVYFRFHSLREVVNSKDKPHFADLTNAIDHKVK